MIPTLDPSRLAPIDELTDVNSLAADLVELVADTYERKRTESGEEAIRVLERVVLLRVIDSLWVDHLTAVDDMRRGIGLRAYSQRDPLNEFKVEAYRMFDELKATIRHDVTHNIFRVTVMREAPVPQARRVTEGRVDVATGAVAGAAAATGAATATAGGNGAGAAQQPVRAGPKLGRNDPCWCGSGKKYKRCHGA
jgi:preprotein translocase subunit SecA